MAATVPVTVPGGIWADGERRRDAELRPLRGEDELFLAEEAVSLLPAARVTALLTRCLTRLGPHEPVQEESVRSLAVGDREALLLHLRRISLGERIPCVLVCPDCGEGIDVDLEAGELLLPAYEDWAEWHDAGPLRFRLPTGADQEDVAELALDDPGAAASVVLERCVAGEGAREEVPALMARLDPQAELELQVECPACGAGFDVLFDTADYVFRELLAGQARLFREVHELALAYGWSEAEILGLTVRRRRVYLDLLAGVPA